MTDGQWVARAEATASTAVAIAEAGEAVDAEQMAASQAHPVAARVATVAAGSSWAREPTKVAMMAMLLVTIAMTKMTMTICQVFWPLVCRYIQCLLWSNFKLIFGLG